ncbi:MAG: gliding motility lipoprotein GldH [Bacteroidetes bacterium]|nr:gliding motility lipoprotein GldH [Bacteroidota bacterium]
MSKKTPNKLWLLGSILLFLQCTSSVPYRDYVDLNAAWHSNRTVDFELPPLSGNYDLFIHLRNDNNYRFSNIFLIAEWYQNDLLLTTDTLEYAMSAPDGSWLGKGFSEVKESKLYWKEGVLLSDSIKYRVKISHALRESGKVAGIEALSGILSVGLAVENIR